MFNRLFGKKPPAEAPRKDVPARATPSATQPTTPSDPSKTIHDLDNNIVTVDLRIGKLEKDIELEVEKAKGFLAAEKRPMALACMKRKKMFEEQVGQLMAQRANLEQMKFALETAALNAEVLRAQARAGSEMSRLNAGMNADKIDETIEGIRDAMEDAKQIGQMLGEPMGETHDEDELLDELNDLCAADAAPSAKVATGKVSTGGQAATLPVLPQVVNTEVGKPTTVGQTVQPSPAAKSTAAQYTEEDEELLRQLQAA